MIPVLGAEQFEGLFRLLKSAAGDFDAGYWRLRPPEYWENLPEGLPEQSGEWSMGALLWLNPDGSIGYPDEMHVFMDLLKCDERLEELLRGLYRECLSVRPGAGRVESEAEA